MQKKFSKNFFWNFKKLVSYKRTFVCFIYIPKFSTRSHFKIFKFSNAEKIFQKIFFCNFKKLVLHKRTWVFVFYLHSQIFN